MENIKDLIRAQNFPVSVLGDDASWAGSIEDWLEMSSDEVIRGFAEDRGLIAAPKKADIHEMMHEMDRRRARAAGLRGA